MMPVAATPFPSRDPATGKFAPQCVAGIESRMPGRARCIQLLNRLYEVPPPSLAELSKRRRVKPAMVEEGWIAPSPDENRETDVIAWAPDDWPHFDDDFREYEQILKHVGHDLFGDTRRIAPARLLMRLMTHRHDAIVARPQDMNADQATALGWSISWYGFSRTCAPEHELSHAGHGPDRMAGPRAAPSR